MNRITRMLTTTGLGVFAAVSVGAAPAMATADTAQAPSKAESSAAKTTAGIAARTRTIDIYRSRGECNFAGRLGERQGAWDDYDCDRTRGGYLLRVRFDSWGGFNGWDNDDWDGPWGIRGHHYRGGGHFRNVGNWNHGGRDHGNRGWRGWRGWRPSNGVGATPGLPTQIPPIGTTSP